MRSADSGGAITATIHEETELVHIHTKLDSRVADQISSSSSSRGRRLDEKRDGTVVEDSDRNETLPSPIIAPAEQLQTWRSPRINLYRVPVTFLAFLVLGMNDATYGPLIPYLEQYYELDYTIVSLGFLAPFVGYNIAALLNNKIHLQFGQRGVALLAPCFLIAAYLIIALHPPFPVVVVSFAIAGVGNGLIDAAWNAWIGAMANANELLGLLHGLYGLGAMIAPLITTTMITKAGLPWYYWYYILLSFAILELVIGAHAFWSETATRYRDTHARTTDSSGSRLAEAVRRAPAARVTWLCSFFFLGYVGVEFALGGWIVTFMIRERGAEPFASGMAATGFWLGLTLGRLILGFVTPRIGEKLAIAIYLPVAMGLELLFWLVPQFYVSAVAVAFQGFFLGPMFPGGIIAMTKLLPKHLHLSAIGFAAAIGGSGGAIFPFAVGAIAQVKGVQVLQPIILALLAVILMLWLALPKMNKKAE